MRSCSRGALRPSFASTSPSFKTEGAGKAGCRLHPRSCAQKTHEWTTGSTGSLRLSPREWVTAYFELSPVTGLVDTVALRIVDAVRTRLGRMHLSQDLTPASGRQDHTTSPSAPVPARNPAVHSCRAAGSSKVGWQRRSSARRPIAHGKSRPAIPARADAVASIASHRAFVTTRDPPLFGWDGASL
jgi:hypothetical protein